MMTFFCGSIYAQNYSVDMANAKESLEFYNYLGNTENIHPKVLYFPDQWNGYEFWMAYTPYPLGDINAENPCIAVSHDGLNWYSPSANMNPLDPVPEGGYNSDTHLVYDEKNDALEIIWRPFDNARQQDSVARRISKDGVTWTDKETLIDYGALGELVLSPALWIEGDEYKMVYSNITRLKYTTANRNEWPLQWSEPIELPIEWGSLSAWHQDVMINEDGDWELVVCAWTPGNGNNSADLYYVKVYPEEWEATLPILILHRGEGINDIDHRSIYRASLVKVEDEYRLYYSSIDDGWSRHMALSRGESPLELYGAGNQGIVTGVTEESTYIDFTLPFKIYDINGRKIKFDSLNSLPSGIYILQQNDKLLKFEK